MRTALPLAFGALLLLATSGARAQPQPPRNVLSLGIEDALGLAEKTSENVAIARAGVLRAHGQRVQAWSEWLPQINGLVTYDRTLASEYEGLFTGGGGDLGGDFSQLPFGQRNTWRATVTASENLYAGGRTTARLRASDASMRTAELGLASARAGVILDTAQAYYDAVLASRLLAIAEAALAQAEQTLEQTRLGRQQGLRPEFDLLRAQVSADNQRPQVLQARIGRDLAVLRLKQLLEIPLQQPLELTSQLEDSELPDVSAISRRLAGVPADNGELRIPIQQALAAVEASEAALRITASQHFPQLNLVSIYGWVAYPPEALPPIDAWRNNWTVGVQAQVPIFNGLRISGEEKSARADVIEARARAQLANELAQLDSASAVDQLQTAQALWEASAGTVSQAERAYQIAELRYREGISTQLELTDSRLLLQQAEANRAQAARDLQVARIRVALLPYLPLGTTGTTATQAAASANQQAATQTITPTERQQQQVQPSAIQQSQSGGGSQF